MNKTSRSSRLVNNAARSPALAITGPEVARKPTPSSRATICASVVLPRPGGPTNSTWSSASPRLRAASMKIARFLRACAWPTNSLNSCGRNVVSGASSARRSGVTMREGGVMRRLALSRFRKQWPEKRPFITDEAARFFCEGDRLLNVWIGTSVLAVLFVGREAWKAKHRRGDVTLSFGRQKVAVMDAAEPRHQVKPHCTVGFEVGELVRIDLVRSEEHTSE